MLRSLLILLAVGACFAKVNYKTTKKVVSEEEKDRIMANEDDDVSDRIVQSPKPSHMFDR